MKRRDADAALAALGLLRREGFDAPDLAKLEQTAQALRQQVGQERQQQIDRERRAARLSKGLEEIRGALSQRDPDAALAAIGLLRRDGLDAPDLVPLERDAQALQKQLSKARQEEIDQQRRGARLSRGVTEIRAALDKRDADAAAAALGMLKREGFGGSDLAPFERDVAALQQQIEKERREQIDQQRRTARLARGLEDIRAALERRDPGAAAGLIDQLKKDGLDSPDFSGLQRDIKALGKQLEQERKAAASAAAAAAAAASGSASVAAEPWRQVVPGGSWAGSKLPLIGVAAAALLVIGGGTAWLMRGGGGTPAAPPAAATQTASNATTTPGVARPADSPRPVSPGTGTPAPGPGEPTAAESPANTTASPAAAPVGSDAARLLVEVTRAERGGNLREAARMLGQIQSGVPRNAPEAGQAAARLRGIAGTAQRRATQARERAEDANAVGNDDFLSAARAFTQAQRTASRDPQQAIGQFLDAEAGFDRARTSGNADAGRPTASPPTATPQAPPVQPTPQVIRELPKPEPPPPTSAPQPPPQQAPPAQRPAPPAAPDTSADRKAVESVVRRYFSARSTLDIGAIQQVYPGLPADRERGILRQIQGACSEFSERPVDVNVLTVEPQEAMVRTRAQTSCKQKAGGQVNESGVYSVVLELRKSPAGTWQISLVNRPDAAR